MEERECLCVVRENAHVCEERECPLRERKSVCVWKENVCDGEIV